MSTNSEYYLARAEDCAREAAAADLDNVRDRSLRSEAAWRAMAERLMHGEQLREAALKQRLQEGVA